jgi:hypothetical protein
MDVPAYNILQNQIRRRGKACYVVLLIMLDMLLSSNESSGTLIFHSYPFCFSMVLRAAFGGMIVRCTLLVVGVEVLGIPSSIIDDSCTYSFKLSK